MRVNIYVIIALLLMLAMAAMRYHAFKSYSRHSMQKQPGLKCALMATCPQYLKAGPGFAAHIQAELQQVQHTKPQHPVLQKAQRLQQVHHIMPVLDTLLDVTNHLSPNLLKDSNQYVLQIEILSKPPIELEIHYTQQDSVYVIDSIDGLSEILTYFPVE